MCSSAAQSGPIGGLCRPASSSQVAIVGCTGKDGAALTDSSTACGMCSGSGFFLFRGGCYSQTGTPGSEICTAVSNGECTTCATADWLFTNPTNPLTTPGTKCILCSDATGDGTTKGVANCQTCQAPSSAGLATCSACQDGYYKDQGTGACQKCDQTCATCEAAASTCTSCPEGKYLNGNTCVEDCGNGKYADPTTNECKSCATDIPECTACTYSDSLQKPVCSACNSAEQNKLLKKNTDGTTTCVNAAGCATDNQAGTHFLSTDSQKCILCNDKNDTNNQGIEGCGMCKKASASDANPTCTACIAGYYNSASGGTATCVACGANCATCTQAGDDKCDTCKPGYFMKTSSGPGQCFACDDANNQGVEGCAQCSGGATPTCTKCKPNYRKQQNGGAADDYTCTKTCEDETACGGTAGACGAIVINASGEMTYYCSHCGEFTKFPIDGICTTTKNGNDSGCTSHTCTSCTTGYFLYMGGCYSVSKEPGSLMCTTAEGGICTTAANSRYFAVPGAKVTDQSVLGCGNPLGTNTTSTNAYVGIQDCKTCTAPSAPSPAGMAAAKCTACDGGKTLTGSGYGCVTCSITGCSTCKADSMCEACGDGYRLEGDTCVRTGGNLSTGAIA
ncbi:NAD synthase [Giardia duodenalis]|uniref:NAD synthase n=1 Tax=Giardia intestinalis TaxID=5741 RepID=V6TTG7_GIAIN|nr:NAD synthase [Giardia intestinalis]